MDRREGPLASVENFREIYDWAPPTRMIVCPTCRGRGRHVNPAIDSHGISSEDEAWHDEEFWSGYYSGAYDVSCHECGGRNVVEEPDEERMTAEQMSEWIAYVEDIYEDRAMMDAERRAGC